MKHAIEILRNAASVAGNNAPINEAEQKWEQANLERETAQECHAAISILESYE